MAAKDEDGRPVAPKIKRSCLGCQKLFLSGGPGNRICPACARRRQDLSRRELDGGTVVDVDPMFVDE